MFCTNCGTEVNSSDKFCINCGSEIENLYAEDVVKSPSHLPKDVSFFQDIGG